VVAGSSQLLEDLAVLEDIYGNGVLSGGAVWTFVCLTIPIAVAIGHFLFQYFGICKEGKNDVSELSEKKKDAFWKFSLIVENYSIPRFAILAAYLACAGILFVQLMICTQFEVTEYATKVAVCACSIALFLGITALFFYWTYRTFSNSEILT
jgi:hypothetical protein